MERVYVFMYMGCGSLLQGMNGAAAARIVGHTVIHASEHVPQLLFALFIDIRAVYRQQQASIVGHTVICAIHRYLRYL